MRRTKLKATFLKSREIISDLKKDVVGKVVTQH